MKKFGTYKRNPNPPWPCEQPVIVIPPGTNSAAIGRLNDKVRQLPPNNNIQKNFEMPTSDRNAFEDANRSQSERQSPIMSYIPETSMRNSDKKSDGLSPSESTLHTTVDTYLCGQRGKFVKIEFLFGENTHIEKIGALENVGKDFVVLKEVGGQGRTVCSTSAIKFINIY